jgi:hypothetical protein
MARFFRIGPGEMQRQCFRRGQHISMSGKTAASLQAATRRSGAAQQQYPVASISRPTSQQLQELPDAFQRPQEPRTAPYAQSLWLGWLQASAVQGACTAAGWSTAWEAADSCSGQQPPKRQPTAPTYSSPSVEEFHRQEPARIAVDHSNRVQAWSGNQFRKASSTDRKMNRQHRKVGRLHMRHLISSRGTSPHERMVGPTVLHSRFQLLMRCLPPQPLMAIRN